MPSHSDAPTPDSRVCPTCEGRHPEFCSRCMGTGKYDLTPVTSNSESHADQRIKDWLRSLKGLLAVDGNWKREDDEIAALILENAAPEAAAQPSTIFAELGRHHPDCSYHSTIAPAQPICDCGADAKRVVEDMNSLRHMLGVGSHIPKKDWGYRNYFNAGPKHSDMPSLLRLEAAGLIRQGRPEYWHATEAGARAIGLTDRQIKKAFEA